MSASQVEYEWRGAVTSTELNRLHAEAFETRVFSDDEWNWVDQLNAHSFGWVTARLDGELVGFANVISDGLVHAWLQDLMVADTARHRGIGAALVALVRTHVASAGHEYLHVDFDEDLADFYYRACGFRPTMAGLIELG